MSDKNKRVPLGELSAYERWELPNIGDPGRAASQAENARKEKVKPPTAQQIESITKQAYDSGFEEGHRDGFAKGSEDGRAAGHAEGLEAGKSEGYEQGVAQGQGEIAEKLSQLDALMNQLVNPIQQQQQVVEEAMLNVAVALSRAVIHRELNIDSASLTLALSRVMEGLPALDSGAMLKVNEQDYETVSKALEALGSGIELVKDPSVIAGGFLLKTSAQVIDYTVEKRFQKAVQSMLDTAVNNTASGTQEVPVTIDSLSDYSADTLKEEPETGDDELRKLDHEIQDSELPGTEDTEDTSTSGELDEQLTPGPEDE
ncbi:MULTISPECIES: FliH/SctL family protein [unclassified Oleiphilus]|jgi:flagellar assembly protein FliH|uniref:FliH/SctL family protein n=4 Tax=Oleiphilus TaxID=141450 RepID=UPI0007C36CE8|nr:MULTISPECIES: FliH/SctL family protein [unclassified Oleiphilus]KZY47150.1 hypothetical protein A3732_06885 [Oleiphilus sp. HI0050]KZY79034.1 hypothetical protein A3740_07265 [Oleiphilus sp. HI0068]KZY84490.1 hypothetical protein A3741_29535 [Oleiphilus sp. HI0069]KZY92922.1 hypothetical protein A3743_06320 [Oleiphilus sp. HI0072]KZZ19383.1 hypothetical protein A3749_03605 [Oleiphilus sp. HI0078]KZZ22380.1 hypothetical protein A3752_06625 [Oleiphilus sp. HI0081]